jgi:hypothetical protein
MMLFVVSCTYAISLALEYYELYNRLDWFSVYYDPASFSRLLTIQAQFVGSLLIALGSFIIWTFLSRCC